MFTAKNFLRTKYDSLDGKTTVAFQEQIEGVQANDAFTVKVSSSGMRMEGKLLGEITTEADLQNFAEFISNAWTEHRKLAPKLVTTLSGH